MATLKDVARKAGVSTATVSCCLSGTRNVRPETKLRIQQAIEDLKYIPNAAARSLRKMQTNKIGVILPDLSDHFFSEILRGMSQRLRGKNYLLTMACSAWNAKEECELVDTFLHENVAGLLIVSCQPENTEFFRSRQAFGIPIVFLHFRPQGIEACFVEMDNYTITKTMTETMLQKGYRDLVLISGERRFSSEQACLCGVEDAYRNAGMEFSRTRWYVVNLGKEHAFRAAMQACNVAVPHAFFCTSGLTALGVYEALSVLNLRTPQDVLVTTLGEDGWNRSGVLPGVLSSARDAEQMGMQAVDFLLQQVTMEEAPPKTHIALSDHLFLHEDTIQPRVSSEGHAVPASAKRLRLLGFDTPSVRALKMLASSFMAETGVALQIDMTDYWLLPDQIRKDCTALDPEYDLFLVDAPWNAEFGQGRLLADLTPILRQMHIDVERISDGNWRFEMDGEACYGMPFISGTQLLFYRRDIFEKPDVCSAYRDACGSALRPPKTWQEFNRIAAFFTKSMNPNSPVQYGTAIPGCQDSFLAPEIMVRLWASNAKFWDENGTPCLTLRQNERAFRLVLDSVQCAKPDLFQMDGEAVIDAFCNGEAAMILSFSEFAGQIRDSINQRLITSIGYSPLPCKIRMQAGWNLGMNPNSENRDSVAQFLNWFYRDDTSRYYTILGGQSIVESACQNSEIVSLYPWLTMTGGGAGDDYVRSGPPLCPGGSLIPNELIEHILCDVLRDVALQGRTISQSLRLAQEKMEQLFSSYGYSSL